MYQINDSVGKPDNNISLNSDLETRLFIDFLVVSTNTPHKDFENLKNSDINLLSGILEKLLISFDDPTKDNKLNIIKKITLIVSIIFDKNLNGEWTHYKYYLIDTLHKNIQKIEDVPFRIKCEVYKNLLNTMYLVGDFQRFIDNENEFSDFLDELLKLSEVEKGVLLSELKLTPNAYYNYLSNIVTNFSYFASILGNSEFFSKYQIKAYNILSKNIPNGLNTNKVLLSTIGYLQKELELQKATHGPLNSSTVQMVSKLKKSLLSGINIINNDKSMLVNAKVLSLFLRILNDNLLDLQTLKAYVDEVKKGYEQGNLSDEIAINFYIKIYDYLKTNSKSITVSEEFLEYHLSTALQIAEKQTNMMLLMPIFIRYLENPSNSLLRREQFYRAWSLGTEVLGSKFYLSYYGKYLLSAVRKNLLLSDIASDSAKVYGDSDLGNISDSMLSSMLEMSTQNHYQKIQIRELNKAITKELHPSGNDFVETDVSFHGNTHLKIQTKAKLIYIISLIISRCKSIRFMVHTDSKPPIYFTLGFSNSQKKILVRKYLGDLTQDSNPINISITDFMSGLETMTMHGFTYTLDGKDYNVFFDKGKNDTKAFLPEMVEEIKLLIQKCIDIYYEDLPKS